jgi:hypothetical protein
VSWQGKEVSEWNCGVAEHTDQKTFRMPRKDRDRAHDDPRQRHTRPDTIGAPLAENEDTRVTRVDPVPPLSHPYGVLVARELPLYPGIPRTSARNDDPTEPQATLGWPLAMEEAGQVQTTEHSSAPPSGTRNRDLEPELPPVPEQPPVPMTPARARELERMLRLVTPLPTNEWTVAPSVHEWRDDWGERREWAAAAARERRPSRIRARTVLLVVVTLLAAAVIGTALGDARKVTRLVERVTELARGAKPEPAALPLPVKPHAAVLPAVVPPPATPTTQVAVEPPRGEEAPAVPTIRIDDLPLLAAPAEEVGTSGAGGATAKKTAAPPVTTKAATTRKRRPARRK